MSTTLGQAYIQVIPSTQGLQHSLDAALNGSETQNAANNAGGTIGKGLTAGALVGLKMLEKAAGAAIEFGKSTIDAGMSFDSAMSQVAATMGYSLDELSDSGSVASQTLDTLRDFALEMGSTTSFSATESSQALNYMALAGYDAETSMAMLPNVLNLAAAGAMGLAEASDMVTDASSALGLDISETTRLVDQMATASSKSNTSVSQLGEAILTVGGTAKNLSGGTTELSTALGILADNGIKGAEGGTSLRNVILSLSAPTDKASAAMEALGIQAFDAEGNMRPLNDTFNDLNDVLSTMTQQEQTQVLNTLFNKTDLKAVNALLANSGERFDELSAAIDAASGSAAAMAEVQLDNLAGDITLFESALEGAKIAVSDSLTPALREVVQFGSEAVATLGTAFSEGGFSGAMDALGGILADAVKMAVEALPAMVEAGASLLMSLVDGMLANIPLIVSTAASLAVTLVNGLTGALPTLVPQIIQVVTQIAISLVQAAPQMLTAALGLIMALADGLLAALPDLIAALPVLIEGIVSFIIEGVPQIMEASVMLFMAIIDALPEILMALTEAAPQIIQTLVTALTEGIPQILEKGGELLSNLWSGIEAALPGLWSNIATLCTTLITNIANGLATVVDKGSELIANFWAGVDGALAGLWANIVSFCASVLSNIASGIADIVTTGSTMISDFASGIADGAATLWADLTSFGESVISTITNAVASAADIGSSIVSGIWAGISSGTEWIIQQVSNFASGILNAVKSVLGIASPSKEFAKVGAWSAEGIGIGFEEEMQDVNKLIESSVADALDVGGAVNLTTSVGSSIGANAAVGVSSTAELASMVISVGNRIIEAINSKDTNITLDGQLLSDKLYGYQQITASNHGVSFA